VTFFHTIFSEPSKIAICKKQNNKNLIQALWEPDGTIHAYGTVVSFFCRQDVCSLTFGFPTQMSGGSCEVATG